MEYSLPLKIAVAGNVDAGKSTFIGVLKTGKFDSGSGDIRESVFNFPHEKETGRTSSIAQRTIMLNEKKLILVDTCGHERYLRTTIFGISSHYPDIVLILIEGNRGVQKMTREHIITALYLQIPIVIMVTKIDITTEEKLEKNVNIIKKIFKSANKLVQEIKSEDDINKMVNIFSDKIIPLFKVSNVKGDDIDPPFSYITTFLDKLNNKKNVLDKDEECLFVVDKSYTCKGYPIIASGYMRAGGLNVNEKFYLGPINNEYIEIIVRTIHDDNRTNVDILKKDELGCVSIKAIKKNSLLKDKYDVRPGMVITSVKKPFIKKFLGEVSVFSSHSCTISVGYNTVMHIGAIKKTTKVIKIYDKDDKDLECIRGGSKNVFVQFEFIGEKQYVMTGEKFIFREGNTRGFGTIRSIDI